MKISLGNGEKTLIISVVVCLMIMVVGYSFAYFTFGVTGTGGGSSATASTAKLPDVTFTGFSAALNLSNAYPGKSASNTFKISFNGNSVSTSEKVAISLNITSNGFKLCKDAGTGANGCDTSDTTPQLVATISGGGISGTQTIDLTGKTGNVLLATETISKETTYTVTVRFNESNKNQMHNAGKSFAGTIGVQFAA